MNLSMLLLTLLALNSPSETIFIGFYVLFLKYFFSGDQTITTTFERTPIMSSYLLAFVISEFANITNELTREPRETLHRVWTRPEAISGAPFALDNSVKVLKALEEYCYFDYVLPKVDSAAIPNKGGAMENWGEKFLVFKNVLN